MQMSDTIGALTEALAKAQADIGKAIKDNVNPAFKSKYADLASVWDAWQQVGPAHGLSIVQMPGLYREGQASLTTVLSHTSGEYMCDTMTIPVTKQDAQGVGSATTYLRRYALAAFVGIAPDDDDGNAAVQQPATTGKPAFPEGPHRNKTALDGAITAFCGHIAVLTNSDDLEAFIQDQHPTLAQYRSAYGRDSEHVAAITKQIATARERVKVRADLPADEPEHAEEPFAWPETVQRLVAEIGNRETAKALETWVAKAKPLLDELDPPSLAYVRGMYSDRMKAVNAMALASA